MEFKLLGLLEVIADDGRQVKIVRGRESELLALLLLHANEALPPDEIVETLWGSAPPEHARKSSPHLHLPAAQSAGERADRDNRCRVPAPGRPARVGHPSSRHDSVVADRVDARIASGRSELVIEELESLIERSPL